VASLAYRLIEVEEAVVLLRVPAGSGSLVEVARHGRPGMLPGRGLRPENAAVRRALDSGNATAETGRGRRLSAAAPLAVAGEVRGVLAVVGTERGRPLAAMQLQLLAELAELAAGLLEERGLRAEAETIIAAGIDVLARAVDIRDVYTGRHSAQVGNLARRVGERLGMSAAELELLERAARLHDVGKLAVPDTILQKPGPLDDAEWEVMRRHPEWGAEMVGSVPGLERLGALVGYHHERWDGRGYPHGLKGAAIPLASRVISVCDAFEAMVSDRPYRSSLNVEAALGELLEGAGTQFDPAVVAAVVELELQPA
jgi:HD-GYP domain-containing protein (c-di-GMP phosphodiesterase class II)